MKTAVLKRMDCPLFPYPNAATLRELAHKVVDFLLVGACCAGLTAVIIFCAVMA